MYNKLINIRVCEEDKMIKNENQKIKEDINRDIVLFDNSPKAYDDYSEEASILNTQIQREGVQNIAVVAKYGAGKSSVIKTYLRDYRNMGNKTPMENNYTTISLATFNGSKCEESEIQQSILQQLLYSRKQSELPNSKIERTNKSNLWNTIGYVVIVVLFLFSIILFSLDLAGIPIWDYKFAKWIWLALSALFFGVILVFVLHYHKLKRIEYKGIVAEFHNDKKETNLINKFIDEVLYFFECVNVDLVIFEDLDRLPSSNIFVKLRELNTTINVSNKKAKKVTFLYAVKDDLFDLYEERAKFFDFILPVIPIINPKTTEGKIGELLKQCTKNDKYKMLSEDFIKSIALYIPDMRILHNTFNDFQIMFNKLFKDKLYSKHLKVDNLFALCLYKNLFPYDYALLEKGKGLIPLVIDIDKYRQNRFDEIEKEINHQKELINKYKEEFVNSFEELKMILFAQTYDMAYDLNGKINIKDINTFENLDFKTIIHSKYGSNYSIKLPSYENELLLPNGDSYIDREKIIKAKENNGIEKAKKEIEKLEHQKQDIAKWNLQDCVENQGIDILFNTEIKTEYIEQYKRDKIVNPNISTQCKNESNLEDSKNAIDKENDYLNIIEEQIGFLRFMVAQDYIDEYYLDYTTTYELTDISLTDRNIAISIQKRIVNFDAQIENVTSIVKWLNDNDFNKESILSYKLVSELKNIQEDSKINKNNKYNNLVKLLANVSNEKVKEFIISYITISDEAKIDELLQNIIPLNDMLSEEIFDSNLGDDKKDIILKNEIKNNTEDKLISRPLITKYLNNSEKYLDVFADISIEKAMNFIDCIQPSIKKLAKDLNNSIQRYLIENNLYDINLDNLETIFNIDSTIRSQDFYDKNYTTILNSDNKNVINFINDNIEIYINEIWLNSRLTCILEEQEAIKKLLLNENIQIDTKCKMIRKVKILFENINEFNDDVLKIIIDNDSFENNWGNILYVFDKFGYEKTSKYLECKAISGKIEDVSNINEQVKTAFVSSLLIKSNSFTVRNIISQITTKYPLSKIYDNNIIDENLAEIIKLGNINFDYNDYQYLWKYKNSNAEYIKLYSNQILDYFDYYFSYIYNRLGQDSQYDFNESASTLIANVISIEGLDIQIKNKLINEYNSYINIVGNARIFANYIICEDQTVPNNILWQFSNSDEIDSDAKKRILFNCHNNININRDRENLIQYLNNTEKDLGEVLAKKQRIDLPITSENSNLLNILKEMQVINYQTYNNKKVYKVRSYN